VQSSTKTNSSTFLLSLIHTGLILTVNSDWFVAGELGEIC
jgi:hypothetical protein